MAKRAGNEATGQFIGEQHPVLPRDHRAALAFAVLPLAEVVRKLLTLGGLGGGAGALC
jgi:hypothetical protein